MCSVLRSARARVALKLLPVSCDNGTTCDKTLPLIVEDVKLREVLRLSGGTGDGDEKVFEAGV